MRAPHNQAPYMQSQSLLLLEKHIGYKSNIVQFNFVHSTYSVDACTPPHSRSVLCSSPSVEVKWSARSLRSHYVGNTMRTCYRYGVTVIHYEYITKPPHILHCKMHALLLRFITMLLQCHYVGIVTHYEVQTLRRMAKA